MQRRQFLQMTLGVGSAGLLTGYMRAEGSGRLHRPSKLRRSTVASGHSPAQRSRTCAARFTVRSFYHVIPGMTTRAGS